MYIYHQIGIAVYIYIYTYIYICIYIYTHVLFTKFFVDTKRKQTGSVFAWYVLSHMLFLLGDSATYHHGLHLCKNNPIYEHQQIIGKRGNIFTHLPLDEITSYNSCNSGYSYHLHDLSYLTRLRTVGTTLGFSAPGGPTLPSSHFSTIKGLKDETSAPQLL